MPASLVISQSPVSLSESTSFRDLFQFQTLFQQTKHFQDALLELVQIENGKVDDKSRNSAPFVYIHQSEVLSLPPNSKFLHGSDSRERPAIIASAEATTCCILGIQARIPSMEHGRGFVSMAHIDGSRGQLRADDKCAVRQMLTNAAWNSVQQLVHTLVTNQDLNITDFNVHPIDLHLFVSGGMLLESDTTGEAIVRGIFDSLRNFILEANDPDSQWRNFTLRFHLEVFSVLKWNTRSDGFPICTSMGFLVDSARKSADSSQSQYPYLVFPLSNLSSKLMGVDFDIRGVRGFMGHHQLHELFNTLKDCIYVHPFDYTGLVQGVEVLLALSDEEFLENVSTSPEFESDLFVPNMKRCLRFLQENPHAPQYFAQRDGQHQLDNFPLVDVCRLVKAKISDDDHIDDNGVEKQQ